MEEPRDPGTNTTMLEEFLRQERSEIVEEWLRASETVRSHAADTGDILDHLPSLIDAFATAIGEQDPRPLSLQVELHARSRLDAGFSLEEVVREYGVLREIILTRWKRRHPALSAVVLNRALDDAMAASASRYARVRQRTLDALDRISRAGFEISDIDDLLQALLTVVIDSTESVDAGAIFLRKGDVLQLRSTVGLEKDAEVGLSMRIGEGFGGRVALFKTPLELRDAARDPIVRSIAIHETGMRALYGLPLLRKGEVIGVAELGSRTAWEFSDTDKMLFRSMGDRAGSAIAYHWLNEELEAERRRVETVSNLLPVGVFVSDDKGRITLVNPGARDIWGEGIDQAVGRDNHDGLKARRIHDGKQMTSDQWPMKRALTSGETIRNEALEITGFSGIRRFILSSAAPMRADDGRLLGAVEVHADVTEIRRREKELRFLSDVSLALSQSLDLEQTFNRIAHLAVPTLADWCAIDLIDRGEGDREHPEGVLRRVAIAHVDPELEALGHELARRWPPHEYMGAVSKRVVLAGEEQLLPDFNEQVLQEIAQDEEHLEALRRFGIRSFLSVPLKTHDTFAGAISMSTGVSSRRFDETDLRVARELAWRAGIAIDNAWLYKDAQDAIRSRDELWGIAAHELRNPLTSLNLQISAALRQARAGPDGAKRVERKLTVAERQVNRLVALTNELLDTTRARAGRLDIHPEPMDLADLIREVLERNRDQIEARNIEVLCDLEDHVRGNWDPLRLEQVITNLLTNALKYGRGRPIWIRLYRDNSLARLEVEDQGIGITPEDQARVFRPFERAKGPHQISGLGLGLYVSRIIVEAHRGRMSVRSEPGVGSVFTVELPLELSSNGVG